MRKKGFDWLRHANRAKQDRFLGELTELMCSLPIIVHATVVDRPGYNKRYLEQYGPRRWKLCRTAFNVAVERAAKFARIEGARLRVYVEQSDKTTEATLRDYFDTMRTTGLPFNPETSAKYSPFGQAELASTLFEFGTKPKKSIPMQIADLALWPVCKGKYMSNDSLIRLTESGKLLDARCNGDNGLFGIKYSCFD